MNKKALLEVLYFWITITIIVSFIIVSVHLAVHVHMVFLGIVLLPLFIVTSYMIYDDAKRKWP